ncbi:MAG: hypothetical protein HQL96_01220 [Magnetococcales bacterium]|nr:hypothetical protein [Magnetococcales bacterium]
MAQKRIHDSASSRVMAYRKRRMEEMKRIEIWLQDDELAQLDAVASEYGISRARVIGQLLAERHDRSSLPVPLPVPVPVPVAELPVAPAPSLPAPAPALPAPDPDPAPAAPTRRPWSTVRQGQQVFLASLLAQKNRVNET